MAFTRRQMIKGLGAAAAAGSVARPARGERTAAASGPMFAPDHRATLQAAMERLLPGAVEAGVPGYIEFWLGQPPYDRMVSYFRAGAAHLDRVARRLHGKRFVECAGEEQDAVLAEFHAGNINVKKFRSETFFKQLFELVLEGWLSHPKYGGNRNRVGWKYIGKPDGLRSCWWNPKGVQRVLNPDEGFHD